MSQPCTFILTATLGSKLSANIFSLPSSTTWPKTSVHISSGGRRASFVQTSYRTMTAIVPFGIWGRLTFCPNGASSHWTRRT
ncbi:hypothetical protein K438DRAFT_497953 [Mycena galopus ATCC 62051]|nr:hypothetical protein K438DRAFT_497953 [Mycena galopus ATCC 62051]